MTRAAVTVAGGAVALCLGSVPAALAAPAQNTTFVPCNPWALHAAIDDASSGDTLDLAPGCTYYLPGALPLITTNLTIVGHRTLLRRAHGAGSFSLLRVANSSYADLTVIDMGFGDGGGDINAGGAIYNGGGTLNVDGGYFADNTTDKEGGAIYNDGYMTLTSGTFTGNVAPYGGAIDNVGDAIITDSSFTWNKAPTLYGDPDNSAGGAIYNYYHLTITDSGFVANSTGGYGGAIDNENYTYAGHITVTANAADFDGGGIYNDDETVDLFGSTVFGNNPDNCYEVRGC